MTSNPSIFEKAIADSHDYDEDIRAMARKGKGVDAIYEIDNVTRQLEDEGVEKFNKPFDGI